MTRLSLEGGPMRHGASWHQHVLPSLRAFASAVMRMRGDSALRYRYLLAGAEGRRALLREELPHLRAVL